MSEQKILVIGAGPIVIGQACEFDYSGTQACRILKANGYKVILVNPNPATIMTDPETADVVYISPVTTEFIEKIIQKERPDKLLPTVGGQTALNAAIDLIKNGILEKYNVELIGVKSDAIEKSEKRSIFNQIIEEIGLEAPKNITIKHISEIENAFKSIGFPAIIRPSFTLGGLGSGIANTREEFFKFAAEGLKFSPISEVQIDESIIGWKEFELEVVGDKNGNCIVVCPIENVDPMGVHTGDSVTVAPTFTLRDEEYQQMRDAAFAILRKVGVDTGGANVQFAFNPANGQMRVIEMNPRVSRSSALASKATGYPIAKIAAQLATGKSLDQIKNDAIPKIPASFEPTIDYVVVKIPRFNFEKFSHAKRQLSSSMKSVGEAMAIGRSFQEALQKGFCSLEQNFNGLSEILPYDLTRDEIEEQLRALVPNKALVIADAIRRGFQINEIQALTHYDSWFLHHIENLVHLEEKIRKSELTKWELLNYKKQGFSDARIAYLTGKAEDEIRKIRKEYGVRPVFKRVDTCAAEFSSQISYLYGTYECDGVTEPDCESYPSDRKKVIVLGSGPNRIGQGIEFDYACVHAIFGIKEFGYEAIMLNCNPETVSTDYDISDKLYFTPLNLESVLDIIEKEQENGELLGVLLQFGGQTPLKLARLLHERSIKILGTQFDSIDIAEEREKFNNLMKEWNLKQPRNLIVFNKDEVISAAQKIGFPVIVRPSYVLGGQSMQIIYDVQQLEDYLGSHSDILEGGSLLIDEFLSQAIEIDVDAISDAEEVYVAGVMEHIEEAGIHSGDSAFVLPPQKVKQEIIDEIKTQTKKIALSLKTVGLINIQFAIRDNEIYVLEVNPRSSRTVPFIAKATGLPIAKIATKIVLGDKLRNLKLQDYTSYLKYIFVKQPVFSFEKFPGTDVLLGPEMKSTGEVMGIGDNFEIAFANAYIASRNNLPFEGNIFFSVRDEDKDNSVKIARILHDLGFRIFATAGTAEFLKSNGIDAIKANKVKEGSPHIVDMIMDGQISLVINTSSHRLNSIQDSFSIRSSCIMNQIPCCTNIQSALALVGAIKQVMETGFRVYTMAPLTKYEVN